MENPINRDQNTERRKFPRLSISTNVKYSVVKINSLSDDIPMKNISAAGICIVADEDLQLGTVLSLSVYLPDNDAPIYTKGRVVWKSEFKIGYGSKSSYDIGVEFLEIDEEDKQKIFQYVSKLPRDPKEGE
ncbi:MAG: PilZ domain-containing protein [Candidatus Omnitrophota bacterium]|jgi:c-di-GMP-binding flagellar brake protein YcgR